MPQKSLVLNLSGDTITLQLTWCCPAHAHEAFTNLADQIAAGAIEIELGAPEHITPITAAHGTLQ